MSANLQEDQVGQAQASALKQVAGSARFDWIMIFLCGWLLAGVYIDGWAHNHFNIIDTFFTPWHAVLYSGFLAIAIFLLVSLIRNVMKGYPWWSAVPPGYGFSLIGIVVFGIGGISDFFWHTLFGFDVELATLLSPTHLMLAAGGLLIVGGPMRAAWLRPATTVKPRWFSQLPLIISLTFILCALAFMTSFAHPFVSLAATSQYKIVGYSVYTTYLNDLVESWGVLGILLQSGLLIGTMLLIIRRQRAPLGTFTLIFTISLTMACVILGHYFLIPVAVLGGLAADAYYILFKPSTTQLGRLRLFVFFVPVCLFLFYFLDLRLFKDVWWPITIWLGSIFMAGIAGLLLSYVFVPPLKNAGQAATPFFASVRLTRRRMLIALPGLAAAAGGLVVAGSIVLRRSHAPVTVPGSTSFPDTTSYFDASFPQAIVNVPVLLHQASSAVSSAVWSPDGKAIASADSDGTIQLWSVDSLAGTSMEEKAPFLTYRKHNKAVTDLVWSPGGKYIASASEDGTAQVWHVSTGVPLLVYMGHTGRVMAIAWSSDGRQIASAGEDRTVQIWDASTGAHVLTYKGHTEAVVALAWSPGNKRIASASVQGKARVWNASSAARITAFQIDDESSNTACIAWSPDGKYLATARSNLSVWGASTGTLLSQSAGVNIMRVAWSPDGKRLASGQADGTVYIWASFPSENTTALPSFGEASVKSGGDALLSGGSYSFTSLLLSCQGHSGAVNAVAWSPDGRHVVSAGDDQTIQVWDTFVGNTQITYKNNATGIAWSPDGSRIASAGATGTVEVWDVATGTTIVTYKKHPGGSIITSMAWSPGGKQMISASDDGIVLIWDTATGTTRLFPAKQAQSMVAVTWLPDGKHVAMIDDKGAIQVWDATTGHVLMSTQKQNRQITIAAWSPDNRRIAVVNKNGQAQIWDAIHGTVLFSWPVYLRGVTAIAWSPNGKQLVSAAWGSGGGVQVWDVARGDVLFSYEDTPAVVGLTWAFDGKRLAFTSYQGVQVWDIPTGALLLTYQGLSGSPGSMFAASWSPDGKRIASVSNNGIVQVWLASSS